MDEKTKQYHINRKIKEYYKKKYKEEKRKKVINEKCNMRYINNKIVKHYISLRNDDIIHKIVYALASRATGFFGKNNIEKEWKHMELIGCDKLFLKNYLYEKFVDGMTFENYGDWEIDHIFPLSKCNINNGESIKKCFHYTNLQPLWKTENRKKSNKIINNCEQSELGVTK